MTARVKGPTRRARLGFGFPRFGLAFSAIVMAMLATPGARAEPSVDKDMCTLKGIELHGKVQVVDSFPGVP